MMFVYRRWASLTRNSPPTELAFRRELFVGGPEPSPAAAHREQRCRLLAQTAVGGEFLVSEALDVGGAKDQEGY